MRRFILVFSILTLVSILAGATGIMPGVGSPAPGFSLPSQEGANISLDQFKGKWVVLYFYPKDFSSGCTVEAHNFQRDIDQYTKKNAVIVGVSVDDVNSHKGFCAKEGLNFKVLADTKHEVSQEYGSLMEYKGMTLSARNTFVIDPSGVIKKVYASVNPQSHSEQVLADLAELQGKK